MAIKAYRQGSWFRSRVSVRDPDSQNVMIVEPGQLGRVERCESAAEVPLADRVYQVTFFPSGIVDHWLGFEIADDGELLEDGDADIPSEDRLAIASTLRAMLVDWETGATAVTLSPETSQCFERAFEADHEQAASEARRLYANGGTAAEKGRVRIARSTLVDIALVLGVSVAPTQPLEMEFALEA